MTEHMAKNERASRNHQRLGDIAVRHGGADSIVEKTHNVLQGVVPPKSRGVSYLLRQVDRCKTIVMNFCFAILHFVEP